MEDAQLETRLLSGSSLTDSEYEVLLQGKHEQHARVISGENVDASILLSVEDARRCNRRGAILIESSLQLPLASSTQTSLPRLTFTKHRLSPYTWIVKSTAKPKTGNFAVTRVRRVYRLPESSIAVIEAVQHLISEDRHLWTVIKLRNSLQLVPNESIVEISNVSSEVDGTRVVDFVRKDIEDDLLVVAFRSDAPLTVARTSNFENSRLVFVQSANQTEATMKLFCRVHPPALYHLTLDPVLQSDDMVTMSTHPVHAENSSHFLLSSSLMDFGSTGSPSRKESGGSECSAQSPSSRRTSRSVSSHREERKEPPGFRRRRRTRMSESTSRRSRHDSSTIVSIADTVPLGGVHYDDSDNLAARQDWNVLCDSLAVGTDMGSQSMMGPPGLVQNQELYLPSVWPEPVIPPRSTPSTTEMIVSLPMPQCIKDHPSTVHPLAALQPNNTETSNSKITKTARPLSLQQQSFTTRNVANTEQSAIWPLGETDSQIRTDVSRQLQQNSQAPVTRTSETALQSLNPQRSMCSVGSSVHNKLTCSTKLRPAIVSDPDKLRLAIDSLSVHINELVETAVYYISRIMDSETIRVKAFRLTFREHLHDRIYDSIVEAGSYLYFDSRRMAPFIQEYVNRLHLEQHHLNTLITCLVEKLKDVEIKWRFNKRNNRAEDATMNMDQDSGSSNVDYSIGQTRTEIQSLPQPLESSSSSQTVASAEDQEKTVRTGLERSRGTQPSVDTDSQLENKNLEELIEWTIQHLATDPSRLDHFLRCWANEYGRVVFLRMLKMVSTRTSFSVKSATSNTDAEPDISHSRPTVPGFGSPVTNYL